MMRVIAGEFRGRKLKTLAGDAVRPTSDKVKEAIFSSIQFEIEGMRFLDLFAGSGQMGIEALSRGAKNAMFVDSNHDSINVVNQNVNSLNLRDRSEIINMDSILFLHKTNQKFDIAYLDPPYQSDCLDRALKSIGLVMEKTGIIICESPSGKLLPEMIEGFSIIKKRNYGKISATFYKQEK